MRFKFSNRIGVLAAVSLVAAFAASGCAKAPAGTGTGPRLAVTLRFNGPINPTYYYYVLIRNAPDTEQLNPTNYPIPIVTAPYAGNGFATDKFPKSGTAAFTDFILYGGGGQPTTSGYGVYHVLGYLRHGDPNNPATFRLDGNPDIAVRPSSTDPNTLSFEISLSRMRADAGECDTTVAGDCPTAKFLNINVIATNKTASDPNSIDPQKYVDAIGDQSSQASFTFNTVVTIETAQVGRVYQSSTSLGDPFYEPDGDAIDGAFSSPGHVDGAVELIAWQMQVKQ